MVNNVIQVSQGCLATAQLWKLDYLYILYSSVARQQGGHLIRAFEKLLF